MDQASQQHQVNELDNSIDSMNFTFPEDPTLGSLILEHARTPQQGKFMFIALAALQDLVSSAQEFVGARDNLYRDSRKIDMQVESTLAEITRMAGSLYAQPETERDWSEMQRLVLSVGELQKNSEALDSLRLSSNPKTDWIEAEFLEVVAKLLQQNYSMLPTILRVDYDATIRDHIIRRYIALAFAPNVIGQQEPCPSNTFPLDGWQSVSHSVSHMMTSLQYIEVPVGVLSEVEQKQLYQDIGPIRFFQLIRSVIPDEFHQTGYSCNWGGCSHHSGYAEGQLIVLEGGQIALIAHYDNSDSNTQSSSVIGKFPLEDIARYLPNWSAKRSSWEGPEVTPVSADELNFIRSILRNNTIE